MSAEQPVASTSATHAESTLRNGDEKAQQEGKPSKSKMRGRREDTPDVRASKTLSYILRHGASKEGLKMRKDGFVRVDELVSRHSWTTEAQNSPRWPLHIIDNGTADAFCGTCV